MGAGPGPKAQQATLRRSDGEGRFGVPLDREGAWAVSRLRAWRLGVAGSQGYCGAGGASLRSTDAR